MSEEIPPSGDRTEFAPFEAEKSSQLAYKGKQPPPAARQIEFRAPESSAGPTRVLFRKIRSSFSGSTLPAGQRLSLALPASAVARPSVALSGDASSGQSARLSTSSRRDVSPGRQTQPSRRDVPPGSDNRGNSQAPPTLNVTKSVVLKRIGNLERDQESSSDLKKYWMPDKACRECSECQVKFNILVRRHHCRICGRIFCHTCCSLTIPGGLLRHDLQGFLRACKECFDIYHNYRIKTEATAAALTESQNVESSLSPRPPGTPGSTTEPLHQSSTTGGGGGGGGGGGEAPLMRAGSGSYSSRATISRPVSVLSPHVSWDDASAGRSQEVAELSPSRSNVQFDNPTNLGRSVSGRARSSFESIGVEGVEEEILTLDEDEVEYIVSEVWVKMRHPISGLHPQSHRYRLRNFPNTFTGHDIVDWLVVNENVRSRMIAVKVGQVLVDTKRLKIVSTLDAIFRDDHNFFLDLGEAAVLETERKSSPTVTGAPKWFQHIPTQDGDSEFEGSYRGKEGGGGGGGGGGCLVPDGIGGSFVEPTVTVSSVSELTGSTSLPSGGDGVSESSTQRNEDYLVILPDEEKEKDSSPFPDSPQNVGVAGGESGLSATSTPLHVQRSNTTPESRFRSPSMISAGGGGGGGGGPHSHSFSVIDNREFLRAISVGGLSSAAEVAKEIANEGTGIVKKPNDAAILFEKQHDHHFDCLMIQLMQSFGVSLSWLGVITPLIMESSRKVKTNVLAEDVMDINEYVKIKKIHGGHKSNCSLVYGVVCSKNVTHKKMKNSLQNPTILLLKCAFDFQRRENQLSSFDTLQLQEEKYLKNLVARVKTFKPSIILVQKSVSRLALEMLFELGIVVAVNVKQSVMTRIARATKGDILHSLDQIFFDVQLGTCGHFYVRDFTLPSGIKKTLMYFDNCEPKLGCVIILQGATKRELKKVKNVTRFGLHIAHNSILETAFLLDEFAWPSSSAPQLLPSVDGYSSSSSTPEWPLYPSLVYPLQMLPPNELAKKLVALGAAPVASKQRPDQEGGEAKQCEDSGLHLYLDTESSTEPNLEDRLPLVEDDEFSEVPLPSVTPPLAPTPEFFIASPTPEVSSESEPSISQTVTPLEDTFSFSAREPSDEDIVKRVDPKTLSRLGEREFSMALENQVVSISPNVQFQAPYLQTADGREASTRQYLPNVIYWSHQFGSFHQRPRGKRSACDDHFSLHYTKTTSPLEMGITRSSVERSFNFDSVHSTKESDSSSSRHGNQTLTNTLVPFPHNYKSVSDHPLTTSIFLLKANSNEMKAALADYRARAGIPSEEDNFFFSSAKKASDYQLHLQNIFNKYRDFELMARAFDSTDSLQDEQDVIKPSEDDQVKRTGPSATRVKTAEVTSARISDIAAESDNSSEGFEVVSVNSSTGVVASRQSRQRSPAGREEGSLEVAARNRRSNRSSLSPSRSHFSNSSLPDGGKKMTALEKRASGGGGGGGGGREESVEVLDFDKQVFDPLSSSRQHVDCLDPCNHQGISILFSSTCHDGQKHQVPCVPPCIITMVYYGRNDISLGEFLLRYCFRPFYRCQSCGVEMLKHQRHVIHSGCGLHITLQQLDGPVQDSADEGVYTWLACRHCDQACTPYTRMSESGLRYSFAKFIELKFHCDSYTTRFLGNTTCGHSLHKDYMQHFSHKNKIVAFQQFPVSMLEVYLPPNTLEIHTPHSEYHHDYAAEIKQLQRIIEGVFYRIKQRLCSYQMEPVTGHIPDHIANSKVEREALRNKVKILKEMSVSAGFLKSSVSSSDPSPPRREGGEGGGGGREEEENLVALQDGVEELKRSISEVVDCWNINLEGLDSAVRAYRHRRDHEASPQASPITLAHHGSSTVDGPDQQPNSGSNNGTSSSTQQHRGGGEGGGGGEQSIPQRSPAAVLSTSVTPCVTPTSHTPVNSSPDLSHYTRRLSDAFSDGSQRSSVHSSTSLQPPPAGKAATIVPPKSHVRNLSDSGVHQANGSKNTSTLNEPGKSHRRQLSDSITVASSTTTSAKNAMVGSSELKISLEVAAAGLADALIAETDRSSKSEEHEMQSLEDNDSSKSVSSGSEVLVSGSDGASLSGSSTSRQAADATEPSGEKGSKSDSQLTKTPFGMKGEPSHTVPPPPSTPSHAPTQEDDVTLPDSSSGIFAKLRGGREQEDPLKYYLWGPSEIAAQGSPVLSAAAIHQASHDPAAPPPSSSSAARGGGQRKVVAGSKRSSAISGSTEGLNEGKASDRKQQQREKASLLSRPFQRLPVPFEHSEHHNMQSALKIPVAIYDNEPTSIIAFTLSSQRYRQELQAIRERKSRGVLINGGAPGAGGVASASGNDLKPAQSVHHAKQHMKRQMSEVPASKNSFKAAFNELKKKSSAISLFSFSTSLSIDQPQPPLLQGGERTLDPFEKSDSRRFEASTASVKSYDSSATAGGGQSVKTGGDAYDSLVSAGGEDSDSARNSGHISLEFTAPDKSASFFCKIYYAEECHKLRSRIFPGGEDRFIRSLARCVKYDAKGGKSRSAFCKVADDRFILKQIKSVEIQSLEQFAPHYFEHVTKALDEMRPLALAKIVGIYTLGYRNAKTGSSKRIDVIVMENLLYGRKSAKVFDLKGSMRSRYVDPSKDSSGDVLLDENYLNYICYSPVYVYPHSKCVLMQALMADSEFLARHSVMDYSLLTCIDEHSGTLVVGIIDYVRTFTLDKRLEMYLKKTAGRTLPTIIYPEQYQRRFCDAMERYFTVVPDKWTGLGTDVKFYE